MAQIVLDDIDTSVLAKLSDLAARNKLSIEEQAKGILADGIQSMHRRRGRLEIADRIAAMTPQGVAQTNSTILIREDRDRWYS